MRIHYFFSNPLKLYLEWLLLILLFTLVGIPILSSGHSAGEQRPLVLFSLLLEIAFYGFLFISILIPIFFFKWFKKYWYISISIALLSLMVLF